MVAEKKHGRVKKNTRDDLFVGSEARFSLGGGTYVNGNVIATLRRDGRRRRSGGLLFMKEAIEEGERKKKRRRRRRRIHRPHGAMHIHIYIYNVVNCQRYYGLCPVSDQQNLLSLLLAPSQFFSPLVASLEAANPLPR